MKDFEDWMKKVKMLAEKIYSVSPDVIELHEPEFFPLFEDFHYTPRRAVEHFAKTYL